MAYLAILELEQQEDLGALDRFLDHFRGDPAVGGIGLPCSCADIVRFRHCGRRAAEGPLEGCRRRGVDEGGSRRRGIFVGVLEEEGGRHSDDYRRLGRGGCSEGKDIHQD